MEQQNIEIAAPIKVQKIARVFSPEDKHKICTEWRTSGLSKHQFCKQRNICDSVLQRWILSPRESLANISKYVDFLRVIFPERCHMPNRGFERLIQTAILWASLSSFQALLR
jgi:hypothetical protein